MIDMGANLFLFAQTLAQAEAASPEGYSGWVLFLIIIGMFVLPFVLGNLIANALKLKDLASKISTILLVTELGLAPFVNQMITGNNPLDAMRWGIDLIGGTNLVYQVIEEEGSEKKIDRRTMEHMVNSISKRLNPSGAEAVVVRVVGTRKIEVIFPGADPETVERKKREMVNLGTLEFAILANTRKDADIIAKGEELANDEYEVREGGRTVAMWRPVGFDEDGKSKPVLAWGKVAARTVERKKKTVTEFLVLVPEPKNRITGEYLTSVNQTNDDSGGLAVSFRLDATGGRLLSQLTRPRMPAADEFKHRMAILLNNEIHSAPGIEDALSQNVLIRGRFSFREIQELIAVLRAGSLEVPIDETPINEYTISPLLGADVQTKGKNAILAAAALVLIFMFVYYMFAGMVANLCLLLNLVLVLGTMAFIEATFTLPGLAGIVLTIGMAVDANVLIFERIREELNRGSSLRMAIQNGFAKAFTTIVDANVTTLITAVVLYTIGTDQVKGFAVTLFIGIVMSMFSSLYFGRLVFDIFERKRWLKSLKMFSMVGSTQWNFISKRKLATFFSLGLIFVGMSSLFARGNNNLDIDFTGGTMVTFEFEESQQIDQIRDILNEVPELGSSITLEQLTLSGQEQDLSTSKRFRLRTKEQDFEQVKQAIHESLTEKGFEIRRVTLDFSKPTQIAQNQAEETKTDSDKNNPEKTVTPSDSFAKGHQTEITLSDQLFPETVKDAFLAALSKQTMLNDKKETVTKYQNAESLIELVGLDSDSQKPAAETKAVRFLKYRLKVKSEVSPADLNTTLTQMQTSMNQEPLFDEVTTFASAVASEMRNNAIMAMLVSLLAIVGYIWFRFQRITFGLAAVIALVHDILVVVGMVALGAYLQGTPLGSLFLLSDFKINLPMIAAFLTIVGYSLNDTIVVFDRIREVRGKSPLLTEEMINTSLNQTLSRTILTSLTTFIVVMILYAIGGEGIHGFAYCLVIGVIIGTYSSIYVASPALLWLMQREQKITQQASS